MRRPTIYFLAVASLLLILAAPRWWAHAEEEPLRPAKRSPEEIAADRDSLMEAVLAEIAGKEELPADSVFKNIKLFKGVPAGRIPRIMNMGFSRSLGVSCDFCHESGNYASEKRPKKEVARQMFKMVQAINNDYLWQMEGVVAGKTERERPAVNCAMCHRGEQEPSDKLLTATPK